jgi:hypothetical protein
VALSLGGIWRAAYITKVVSDGQGGGALGVAATFLILFSRRSFGARAYRSMLEKYPNLGVQIKNVAEKLPVDPLDQREVTGLLIGIFGRFNVEADEQRMQNRALTVATVIATVVWGFGDIAARALQQHAPQGVWAYLRALVS